MIQPAVLITGAGSGIGRAVAQMLAPKFPVVLVGRKKASLQATADLIPADAHSAYVLAVDIRDSTALLDGLKQLGVDRLHAIVANAGVGGENHWGASDRWQEVIDINLTGTYNSVSACVPLLKQGQGLEDYRHIVVVSSILARLGVPGYTAYCASKAGLLGLMRSWANQFAAERILVNAICPGWVNTEMARQGIETFAETSGESIEAIMKREMGRVPLGKMAEPNEVAALVDLLVGGRQRSFTGQTLDMNNGALMP